MCELHSVARCESIGRRYRPRPDTKVSWTMVGSLTHAVGVEVSRGTPPIRREKRTMSEQTRIDEQLDQLVAERTSELAAANDRLRELTETIPVMLWSATPDGAIDYCNGRFLEYTGLDAEQLMGRGAFTKVLHPDDLDRTVQAWLSCIRTGAAFQAEVRKFHAADAAYRWCMVNARPLLDEHGRTLKWYGTVVDMHDWRQAQEELRHTQEKLAYMMRVTTMGELTASIAHEVNQPLSGIMTNAGTCLR